MTFQRTDLPTVGPAAEAGERHKLAWIDASRGVAASLVVMYHVARHLNRTIEAPILAQVFQFGHAAIDYFFVTSGFIILFVHYDDINRPARLPHYLGRRATRLLPIYWIALGCTVTMQMLGAHPAPPVIDLAWSASLWPTQHPLIVGIAWTLQFEMLFYAAFALLIANRTAGLTFLLAWLSVIATGLLTAADLTWLPMPYWASYNFEFFAGMAVALMLRHNLVRNGRLVLIAGLSLLGVMCMLEDWAILPGYGDFARLAYGAPSSLTILGLALIDRPSRKGVPLVLRRLGEASYSIYLFQFVFIGVCWKLVTWYGADRFLSAPLLFIALTGASIAGGLLVSAFIERPLLRLLRKPLSWSRNRPHRGLVTPAAADRSGL